MSEPGRTCRQLLEAKTGLGQDITGDRQGGASNGWAQHQAPRFVGHMVQEGDLSESQDPLVLQNSCPPGPRRRDLDEWLTFWVLTAIG